MVQEIGEKVSVIARFRDNRFEPVRFKWEGRLCRIRTVTGRWSEHDGQYKIYHFSVVSETDSFYELSFHTKGMEWVLDRFTVGE
jgi:hypothetical protein